MRGRRRQLAAAVAVGLERGEREAADLGLLRFGEAALPALDAFVRESGAEIVPFDLPQLRAAQEAYRRFGKGRHPAGLNFGDCMSYALARVCDEPLLYKGGDFARTDIASAERIP